jgi:hypothetical protein
MPCRLVQLLLLLTRGYNRAAIAWPAVPAMNLRISDMWKTICRDVQFWIPLTVLALGVILLIASH